MDSMYGDAEEVVVWLGDSSNDSKVAISTIKKWSEWYELKGKADKDAAFSVAEDLPLAFEASAIEAVSNLLSRPYWERVWVVQEVACAKEVLVMCGSERLAFDDFENACFAWDMVCDSLYYSRSVSSQFLKLDSLRHRHLQQMIRHRNFRILSYLDLDRPRAPFLAVLESCRHLKCSNPRDKIYGFLALGGPHTSRFTAIASPDYKKSTEEVYCEVAERLLLDDQSLRLVAIASGVSSCPTNITKLSLPSWVPDWTCGDSLQRLNFDFVKPGDNLGDGVDIGQFVRFSDDHRTLVAKGVIYDTIAKTYPPEWLTDMKAHKASILGSLLGEESSSGIPKFQGLFQALSLNMEWPEPGNAESRRSFLNKAGWYLWKFWPRDGEESSHDPTGVLLALDFFRSAPVVLFQEFEAMIRTGIRWKESDVQKDIVDFWEAATRRMRHRILFETEQGRIGLGPLDTRMGHKICILHGFSGPLCLESSGSWFILRGECCVAGLSVTDLATALTSLPSQDIEIH